MWLSKRNAGILDLLIQIFAGTHRPVSSRDLSAHLPYSPSSLRKDLQQLESRGFVTKSSASSGRIPTNLALKYTLREALRNLDRSTDLTPLPPIHGFDFQNISDDFLLQLSSHTGQVGFVQLHSIFDLRFRRIRLIKVGPRRVMTILHSMHGWSISKVFSTRENHPEASLRKWQELLNREYRGRNLQSVFHAIRNRLFQQKEQFKQIYRELYFLLNNEDLMAAEFLFKGTQNILDSEIITPRKVRCLLEALDEKAGLTRFLNDLLRKPVDSLNIAFGSDTGISDLDDFLLISSSVYYQRRPIGNVGVIGPKFRAGTHTLSSVERYSSYFTEILSRKSMEV